MVMNREDLTIENIHKWYFGEDYESKVPDRDKIQTNVISKLSQGVNTLVMVPTGFGKSMCFQSAACMQDGLTVVLTPTTSLIIDQVYKFNDEDHILKINGKVKKMRAVHTYGVDPFDYDFGHIKLIESICTGSEKEEIKLLYLTPELFTAEKFKRLMFREFEVVDRKTGAVSKARLIDKITTIVVDEAHCMVQWGFDFRESYLESKRFIDSLLKIKKITLAGFSASMTLFDLNALYDYLHVDRNNRIELRKEDYKRKNLNIKIIDEDQPDNDGKPVKKDIEIQTMLESFLKENKAKDSGSVIIYSPTIDSLEILYKELMGSEMKELRETIALYHGRLSKIRQKEITQAFKEDKKRIILATKAFGMGIDKPYIRLIIHYQMPASPEDYYQEIGRAGRDDKESDCILYYGSKSRKAMLRWLGSSKTPHGSITGTIDKDTQNKIHQMKMAKIYKLDDMIQPGLSNPKKIQDRIINYFFATKAITVNQYSRADGRAISPCELRDVCSVDNTDYYYASLTRKKIIPKNSNKTTAKVAINIGYTSWKITDNTVVIKRDAAGAAPDSNYLNVLLADEEWKKSGFRSVLSQASKNEDSFMVFGVDDEYRLTFMSKRKGNKFVYWFWDEQQKTALSVNQVMELTEDSENGRYYVFDPDKLNENYNRMHFVRSVKYIRETIVYTNADFGMDVIAASKGIMERPYEFHMNNTNLANMIRNGEYDKRGFTDVVTKQWRNKSHARMLEGLTVKERKAHQLAETDIDRKACLVTPDPSYKGQIVTDLNESLREADVGILMITNKSTIRKVYVKNEKGIFVEDKKSKFIGVQFSNFDDRFDELETNEKKRKKTGLKICVIRGPREEHKVSFHLTSNINRFDMLVLDAIYTLENYGIDVIRVQDICRVITGQSIKSNKGFSHINSDRFPLKVKDSIRKMTDTCIEIKMDDEKLFEVNSFLQLEPNDKDGLSYNWNTKPWLHTYAENEMNGEILKIPNTYLMRLFADKSFAINSPNIILATYITRQLMIYARTNRMNVIRIDHLVSATIPYIRETDRNPTRQKDAIAKMKDMAEKKIELITKIFNDGSKRKKIVVEFLDNNAVFKAMTPTKYAEYLEMKAKQAKKASNTVPQSE